MDNTQNNQSSPLPPNQSVQPTPQDVTSTVFPAQQPPSSTPSGPIYPQSSQQDLYASAPPSDVQNQPPTQPLGEKKITLDDLYGPSGFADETASLTPLSGQPPIPTTAAQPVPINGQPVSSLPVQPMPNPVEPVPPPITAQPIMQQPIQSSVQPQLYNVGQSPSLSEVPPTTLQQSQIPDIPTVPIIPTEQVSQSADIPPKLPQEPLPSASLSADLPLRKQVLQSQTQEQPVAVQPVTLQDRPSNPDSENPKGPNKFFLLRLLFGGIGIIILVILLYLGVTLFSSLSPSGGGSGKVTLTYWGLWEDPNTMQSIISAFEQQHPNITIQYEKEDPKEYSQRLLTRIQQGNGPDIFTYHSSWLPMVQSVLVPLPTSVISKDNLENNYYPVVRNDLVKNGALYGIPLGIDTLSLFVNNTMFQSAKVQVPTSWDTFLTVARELTVKDDNGKIKVAGAAMGTFDNITHAPDILSALFMQNGVDVTKMEPKSNAADALNFYTSFATGESNVWDNTLDPSMLAFARGNLAMYFGYSWDIFLIKASNPSLDFSIYPIPHLPGRNITAASYWVEGVSSKSQHQKEALAFMQFLAQKNTEATLYSEEAKTRLFGEPYSRSDLGETLKGNALVYPFVEQATDAKSTFFAGETFDTALNGQMNGYLGNAVRSVLGNTSADSAIDTLMQGVLQIEKQYGSS